MMCKHDNQIMQWLTECWHSNTSYYFSEKLRVVIWCIQAFFCHPLGNIPTQRPAWNTDRPETQKVKIADFNGRSFVQFSLSNLPPEYLQSAEQEEFQFYFLSTQPNSLIWMHEHQTRKMYLAMKVKPLYVVSFNS